MMSFGGDVQAVSGITNAFLSCLSSTFQGTPSELDDRLDTLDSDSALRWYGTVVKLSMSLFIGIMFMNVSIESAPLTSVV